MELVSKKIGEFKAQSHLLSPQNHICEFYSSAEARIKSLCNFIVPGIIKDEAVVVVATFENLLMLKNTLILYAIDVDEVVNSGQLVLLNAHKTLEKFIRNDHIDYMLFFNLMTQMLDELQEKFVGIRAYGEMVDVLYETKSLDLTLELEQLWSGLSLQYHFNLMCGYTAENFRGHHSHIKKICSSHTHLISNGILETI